MDTATKTATHCHQCGENHCDDCGRDPHGKCCYCITADWEAANNWDRDDDDDDNKN